jgi:hypothetical protein
MSSSSEVDSAVGEARPSAKQVLAEKQQALEDARGRYALAKEMRDEEGMGVESGIIEALREIVSEIETELVGAREWEGIRAAKDRLVAIRRAFGSVQSSIDGDVDRVNAAIAALEDTIATLNARYDQTTKLRAESAALADRFSLPKPTLPIVAPPASRDLAVALIRLPNTLVAGNGSHPYLAEEQDEYNMRTRRTYAEAAGTPGGEIIEAAGLKPFPELTERQREFLAAREREKESDRRALRGLPAIPADGGIPLTSL